MSEEEIIERVNKFINITVLYGKTYGMTCDDLKKYQQVFQGLLDLYNKEKEKNEELYKDNQKQWAERCRLSIELDNNTISKDKIKAKIEEINSLKYKDERLDRASIDFVINKFYRLLEEE